MDIVGCRSINAEVELLAAVTMFFQRLGITSQEVCARVPLHTFVSHTCERSCVLCTTSETLARFRHETSVLSTLPLQQSELGIYTWGFSASQGDRDSLFLPERASETNVFPSRSRCAHV
jgi:hypothetical protein